MNKLRSIISAKQFNTETLEAIFKTAREMEEAVKNKDKKLLHTLLGMIMISLFYEPSTRTRLSFESAMKMLGGEVIGTENALVFSSAAKGESLEDSIRVVSDYGDIITLRHPEKGSAERAEGSSRVPVINAGDGADQHPTQALLDLYTIKKSFDEIKGLKIALIGDLLNGRTVRSLSYLIAKHHPENFIYLVSPQQARIGDDIKEYLDKKGVKWEETDELERILSEVDVFYQTRVQRERFEGKGDSVYEEVVNASRKLIISEKSLVGMKKNAIIMHPLPRLTEISRAVDNDHRAIYFDQALNGLYIRMALLKMILIGY